MSRLGEPVTPGMFSVGGNSRVADVPPAARVGTVVEFPLAVWEALETRARARGMLFDELLGEAAALVLAADEDCPCNDVGLAEHPDE